MFCTYKAFICLFRKLMTIESIHFFWRGRGIFTFCQTSLQIRWINNSWEIHNRAAMYGLIQSPFTHLCLCFINKLKIISQVYVVLKLQSNRNYSTSYEKKQIYPTRWRKKYCYPIWLGFLSSIPFTANTDIQNK